jgi:hypothetical protein
MFYKTKKIANLSLVLQTSLFRHYRKALGPTNNFASHYQNWLSALSVLLLGFALFKTSILIFIYGLIWTAFPFTSEMPAFSYKPISLEFWIYASSFLLALYSIKICFMFPKEFRLVLLVEQGLTINTLMSRVSGVKKKISIICIIIIFSLYFPQIGLFIFWLIPLGCEYYCLTSLSTAYLSTKIKHPGNTFTSLLGLEYFNLKDRIQTQVSLLSEENRVSNELDNDLLLVDMSFNEEAINTYMEEDNFEEFSEDIDIEFDDLEDDHLSIDEFILNQSELTKKGQNKAVLLREAFPYFIHSQTEKKQLINYYKKYLFYLKNQSNFKKELTQSSLSLYDNEFNPNQNLENLEVLSDIFTERGREQDMVFFGGSSPFDVNENVQAELEAFGFDDIEKGTNEIGFNDEYKAPNWFWISFWYETFGFWCFLNMIICFSILMFGIPETWLFSTRESLSHNFLIYNTLLNMTEQLYTPWGLTELPVGGFYRIEYFNYFQPSYFHRYPKMYTKFFEGYQTRTWSEKGQDWNIYQHWIHHRKYNILLGSSTYHKKFSDINDFFLYSPKTALLEINRYSFNQDVSDLYINKEFFLKKDKKVDAFNRIFLEMTKK